VGTVFILGPLGLFTNNDQVTVWARALALAMGLIGVLTGGWMVWRSPRVTTSIDAQRRRVVIVERGLAGRHKRVIDFGMIADVVVAEQLDSDGDPTYQPQLLLQSGEHVPMSRVWQSVGEQSEKHIALVRRALREESGIN
jgi:hypothetical protein